MKNKIIVGGAIIIVILLVVLLANKKTNEDIIKIGVIGPFTGDAASYGESFKNGVEIAFGEAGKKSNIQLIFEDTKCDPAESVSAVQKLINIDKIDYLLGGVCSGENLAVSSLINENKIPNIVLGSNPEISEKSGYMFQIWPTDDLAGLIEAKMVLKNKANKIAIVSSNTDYALGITKIFKENTEYVVSDKIAVEEIVNDSSLDHRVVAQKVVNSGADAVVLNTQVPKTLILIAEALKNYGFSGKIYTAYHSSKEIVENENLQNLVVIDAPIVKNNSYEDFIVKYKNTYGSEPSYSFPAVLGYQAMYLYVDLIDEFGSDKKRVADSLNTDSFKGILGDFKFKDQKIDGLDPSVKIVQNKGLVVEE